MTDVKNGAERRYDNPKEIALGFGHVEGRIDDIEVALISASEKIATGITAEERLAPALSWPQVTVPLPKTRAEASGASLGLLRVARVARSCKGLLSYFPYF